ncbi:GntR family transcriptional regulator [Carnobacteriaceae bacterium zg-ZUI78]|uniref:GntR family transcriptional regulator n=1 Tax=Granulicatella sp. zg-84 TaxID=2678503 RepID=UPI0013C24020|nr:GntR family transcriptional regulator [Granulicatella sp. zg-84]MBS4751044.1 GntR family transcriptional regulator [Carnobacteriaceae bacterium zg-ZUI78]NEW65586.1 GntR family transcriptional regulator [Granulicatella sp. zg-84]QMI85534.1 GntR family transcriptional regulator [Carnobacteriaceae bacterium zg-84]
MQINPTSNIPIFLQIAEQLENLIFTGVIKEEQQVPSTTELSVSLSINPHTVLKGMNKLVEEDILYKKRGMGMFVKIGAQDKIREKRKDIFKEKLLKQFIEEAKKLNMTQEEVVAVIKEGFAHE